MCVHELLQMSSKNIVKPDLVGNEVKKIQLDSDIAKHTLTENERFSLANQFFHLKIDGNREYTTSRCFSSD